jgi:uncharacterized protein YhdP
VVLDRPMESTAQGWLEGEGLVLPFQTQQPVLIDRFTVRATGRTARMTASSVAVGRWTVAPARVEVAPRVDHLSFTIQEAVVCDIHLTGEITLADDAMRINVTPSADGSNTETTLACLGAKGQRLTGTFDLSGDLSSSPTASAFGRTLLETLDGTVALTSRKGRVLEDSVAVRVLTYLNVTDLLRGTLSDPGREGLPYDSLVIRGVVKKGILSFDEAVFVSPQVRLVGQGAVNLPEQTIDLTVLAAPFPTTDAVVKKIPLIKDILAGSLVTIPLRVTGPLDKPEVKTLPPTAVAEGLANIMKRTLESPFRIMEPIFPETR